MYPEAYRLLAERIVISGAALAFAGARILEIDLHEDWVYGRRVIRSKRTITGVLDIFRGDFCSNYSYLIDRQRIQPSDLWFNSELSQKEDYDLLLRLCARYTSDFELISMEVLDSLVKRDRQHKSLIAPPDRACHVDDWSDRQIEATRLGTPLSSAVLAQLGLDCNIKPWTIRRALDNTNQHR
jgi:hypothetical protein